MARTLRVKVPLTLLPEFGLPLLHGRDDHVADTSVGETVEVGASAVRLDHVEGLGAAVVGTVEDGSGGETHSHPKLVAGGTCACSSCVRVVQGIGGEAKEVGKVRSRINKEEQ